MRPCELRATGRENINFARRIRDTRERLATRRRYALARSSRKSRSRFFFTPVSRLFSAITRNPRTVKGLADKSALSAGKEHSKSRSSCASGCDFKTLPPPPPPAYARKFPGIKLCNCLSYVDGAQIPSPSFAKQAFRSYIESYVQG